MNSAEYTAEKCDLPDLLGLTEAEVAARLAADGPNELPRQNQRTTWRILKDVLREPMLALLLGGGAIYLVIGDVEDALILLGFACLSVIIVAIQETRTERVLEALRDLTSPRALVIRDGVRQRIAGRDVVRGDVVVLAEGDRVPADAILRFAQDLEADESLLTGESVPVRKTTDQCDDPTQVRPGGDGVPYVYSGSLVVRGSGIAEVIATGPRTEIGRIGHSLATLDAEPPRLRSQTRQVVAIFAVAGAVVSLAVVTLYGVMRGDWLEALLAGIAIGMSMLPEEFPVVLTIFMAMGAWRISRARVLTRRATAIEALGSATVLCADKTGTLTQNRMSIREVWVPGDEGVTLASGSGSAVTDAVAGILRHGILASAREPFDPMERAFHAACPLIPAGHRPEGLKLVKSYGLQPDLLAMSQIWERPDGRAYLIAAKGAPEAIGSLCQLSEQERGDVKNAADAMASRGLRVLGVAYGEKADSAWPESQTELHLTFAGLVGLLDPLREEVPAAVAECRRAGIRVKMITGDYPVTAAAIARDAGLEAEAITTGQELHALDDAALARRLEAVDIYARIMPEQKLRIVNALKASGEIVAMTGDGVNDAPSLKSAHIGVAMGGRGTDVAREASAIVLLDDDFGSIVKAVRLGRRIYDNLRKAMSFIFAVHFPIAGLAILPLLLGLPILLAPVHIAFLEMIIDPICSLVFEAEDEEPDIMDRPPRRPDERLFSPHLIGWCLTQGLVALGAVALVLADAVYAAMPDDELRALTFFALVVVIFALVFANRSFHSSLWRAVGGMKLPMILILAVVGVVLALSVSLPFATEIFRFGPLHADDLGLTLAAGASVLILLELLKPLWRPRREGSSIA